ncbi:TldD/PmbA family protein [Paracoccus laeviglucosivorans]|uniref:PmbA protein n=1 Tax=Paracoccus laeviglucosivorans TaxID=1197861 RepID=A0A521DUD8_9RHOB|nr:TldD/PmbA family protein [Paracoccus laeviglucosivorans]SMO74731.1 microcin-processing peptidase 1. Unknown type peptidase. MEROPS family U62 [Paracoccus laeviglucosivorans]
MSDFQRLQSLTDQLLTAARRAGADQADAVALNAAAVSVDVRGGRLEHAERAEGVEIGLRVLLGGRQACVSASDPSAIEEMATRAVAMAREAPIDDYLGLAEPGQLTADTDSTRLELFDTSEPTPEALQDAALRAEAAAQEVQGISQIETASTGYSQRWMWLQASNGFSAGYARSGHSLSTVAITGEGTGMERDWAGEGRVHLSDMPAPEVIGRLAAERTVARRGARKPPTGAFPILYDERVASGLISHLVGAVNGSAVARGASWLRDAMGEAVLPPGFDLIEMPHLRRYGSSRLFDAEGLATADRALVRDGVLQGWTLDLATGRKLDMASTANASRGAGSPPSPGTTNLVLSQGTHTRDDLIRDMGRGLIVTSMLGASINATTGDYSRGAGGFWVENGEITHAVNECTIAGNLRDMLMRLTAANDAPEWRSTCVPSLLVEGMTVAGA